MTTGRARTMAAHLSRPQNQTCDRLAMEVTYCWCVPFFRTSLLLAPLDLCTYGYGVPLRPGPPASLAGGVFYWLCGTDLFAQQGAERLLFRCQGRTSFCFPPSAAAMAGTTSPKSEPAKRPRQAMEGAATRTDRPKANRELRPLTVQELTRGFLAHEDELQSMLHQLSIVRKLPLDGPLAAVAQEAIQVWLKQHVPGKPHASGSPSAAVAKEVLPFLIDSQKPEPITEKAWKEFPHGSADHRPGGRLPSGGEPRTCPVLSPGQSQEDSPHP